jgi:hypothetical protein
LLATLLVSSAHTVKNRSPARPIVTGMDCIPAAMPALAMDSAFQTVGSSS